MLITFLKIFFEWKMPVILWFPSHLLFGNHPTLFSKEIGFTLQGDHFH
jgi:hypothetical protein